MKSISWEWKPRGWSLMLTLWQLWGLGVLWHGRFNGFSIHIGPACLDILPPIPAWLQAQINFQSAKPK